MSPRFRSGWIVRGILFALVAIVLVVSNTSDVQASVPNIVSFQGRLTDASGNLLGGAGTNYFFKFVIYDSQTGGTQLWPPSTPPAITIKVTQGVFNTLLGDTGAGYSALNVDFNNPSIWLEVQVSANGSSYETLTPRQRIVSSGAAINAETVHGGRFINALGVGQFGSLSTASYSRFGSDTTTHGLSNAAQALFSDSAEFDGQVFIDNSASISLNFEVAGYASASQFFGAGLSSCSGAGQKILWSSTTGKFSCGTDQTGGSSSALISINEVGSAFANKSSISFAASGFTVDNSGDATLVALDYTNGPASRSIAQNITGLWTFGNVGSATFAGSVNIAKGLTANSYQGGGLTACTSAGQFLRYSGGQYSCGTINDGDIPDTITASNYLPLTGGTLVGNLTGTGASFSAGEFTVYASAQIYQGGSLALSGTSSNSFGGSVNIAKGLTANSFQGSGLGTCNGTTQKLSYINGQFGCGTDQMGGGSSSAWLGFDAGVTGGSQVKITSISFDANMFNFANLASSGILTLDWANGPASRAASQTITGAWNFTAASNQFSNTLEIGTASLSGALISNFTGSNSFAGSLNVTKGLTANSFQGGGLGACNAALQKLLYFQGQFFCGADQTGTGGASIGLREGFDTSFINFSSLSFNPVHFNLDSSNLDAHLSLDWVNGPASRSATQSITGAWTFTAASTEFNTLEFGTASSSGVAVFTGTGSNSFAGSLNIAKSITSGGITASSITDTGALSVGGNTTLTGTLVGNSTASNSFAGSLSIAKGLTANSYQGGGLSTCNGTTQKLTYIQGQFGCGTDQTSAGGGIKTENSGTQNLAAATILNFDDGNFSLTASGTTETIVKLDWVNGPASRSATQSITGAWTFTAASTQFNTLEFANASSSGVAVFTGTGSNSFAGSLDVSKGIRGLDITASGRFLGLGVGSNSFAGSLNVTKSLTVTKTITSGGENITGDILGNSKGALFTVSSTSQLFRIQENGGVGINTTNILGNGLLFVDTSARTAASESFGIRANSVVTGSIASISATGLAGGSVFNITVPTSASSNDPHGILLATDTNGVTLASLSMGGKLFVRRFTGAGLTDCDSKTTRLTWTASGSNAGKFGCTTDAAQMTMDLGFTDIPANRPGAASTSTGFESGYFWNVTATTFTTATTSNEFASTVNTAGRIRSCKLSLNAVMTAGAIEIVMVKNGVIQSQVEACRSVSNNFTRWGANSVLGPTDWTFSAGDRIAFVASTNAAYAPATLDARLNVDFAFDTSADLAEIYYSHEDMPYGVIMEQDASLFAGAQPASGAYSDTLLGIVSQVPGLTLGSEDGPGKPVKIALSGRTPVFVTGKVKPGDYITSSDIPGVGQVATHAGPIVGQAIASKDTEDVGRVLVFIKNGWWNGHTDATTVKYSSITNSVTSGMQGTTALQLLESLRDSHPASISLDTVTTDHVIAGLDVVAPSVTTRKLTVGELHMTGSSLSIVASGSTSPSFTIDSSGNATFRGNVTAANLSDQLGLASSVASISSRLEYFMIDTAALYDARAGAVEDAISSVSAQLSLLTARTTALELSGIANGGLIIQGDATINGDTYFFGRPYFMTDTGGFAVIPPGQTEVSLAFDQDYIYEPVVNVTIALDAASSSDSLEQQILSGDIRYIVTRRSTHGFTIRLATPAPVGIPFNWTALAIREPKTFVPIIVAAPTPAPSPTPTPEVTESPVPSEDPTPEPSDTEVPTPSSTDTPEVPPNP